MPLFRRTTQDASLLPDDIVQRMEYYGHFEFSPQESEPDVPDRINELIYQALYPIASADSGRFITELADAVLPVGGWADYGGERCVRDLINAQRGLREGLPEGRRASGIRLHDAGQCLVLKLPYTPAKLVRTGI